MSEGLGFGPGAMQPARLNPATRPSAAPQRAPGAGAASGTGGGAVRTPDGRLTDPRPDPEMLRRQIATAIGSAMILRTPVDEIAAAVMKVVHPVIEQLADLAEEPVKTEQAVRAKVAEEIEQTFGPFRDRYDLDEGDLAMAHSITWHLKGLCDNCGRTVDDLPCGVAHGFRLTGRMLDQAEVRARREAAAIARGGQA